MNGRVCNYSKSTPDEVAWLIISSPACWLSECRGGWGVLRTLSSSTRGRCRRVRWMTSLFSFSCPLNRHPLTESARFANTGSMSNTFAFTGCSLSLFLLTGCGTAIWKPAMVTHTHMHTHTTTGGKLRLMTHTKTYAWCSPAAKWLVFFPHNRTSVEPNAHCSCWLPRLGRLPRWDCTSHETMYPCSRDRGFLVAHNVAVHRREWHTHTFYWL